MRPNLPDEVLKSFKSALSKLTGFARREFAAELCETYFDNSPRRMERYIGVSRSMIELGLHERRTGIRCVDNFNSRGAKKKKIIILH
jgi:hypothetical protein